MQIHTTHRHRHFVAIPVTAFAMLFLGGVINLIPVRAEQQRGAMSVHLQADQEQSFSIGTSVTGMLYEGSVLRAERDGSRVSLVRGQTLLAAREFLTVDIGALQVDAFGTSFYLVKGDMTTIAALEAPIVVTIHDKSMIVVPGTQLSIREDGDMVVTATLPSDWQAERRRDAKALLSDQLSDDRSMSAETLLGRLDATDVLMQRRLLLLRMITLTARMPEQDLQTVVVGIEDDVVLRENISAFLPALTAVSRRPLSPLLVQTWADRVIESGLRKGTGTALLVRETASLPTLLEEQGFPLQADLWRASLRHIVDVLLQTVSTENRMVLTEARDVFTAEAITLLPKARAEFAPKKPKTSWTADELSAITHQALVHAGALIATSTAFVPNTETQTVEVQGIFVAENSQDVPYSFTYDPAARLLLHINRNGERLPNTVSLEIFFR